MSGARQVHDRQSEALRRAMGSEILDPLGDPQVVEIMLNPDGSLWVEPHRVSRRPVGLSQTGWV